MKYVIDTEFIDTPSCSALISLAVVREDGEALYFEFAYPDAEITPWLTTHVLPHLGGCITTPVEAKATIERWIGGRVPEFWAYYGAYDYYWFSRIFGGFMEFPKHWPMLFHEFAYVQQGVPDVAGAEHNALNDARSVLAAMKLKGLIGSEGISR